MTTNSNSVTQQEKDRILSLPQRSFIIGGQRKTGLYDQDTNKFYLLDEDGKLTGRCVALRSQPRHSPPKVESGTDGSVGTNPEERETPEKAGVQEKKKVGNSNIGDNPDITRKAKPIFIGLAVVAVVAVLAVQMGGFFQKDPSNGQLPADTPEPGIVTTNPDDEPNSADTLNEIAVVQVVRDLIPGDVITPDDLQSQTISADSFSSFALSGNNIYKWERSEELVGKYINTYTQAGTYLSYNNVEAAFTFASNPWTWPSEGTMLIEIPIDDENLDNALLNYGAQFNLEIRKETVNKTPTGGTTGGDTQEPTEIPGLNHSTTVDVTTTVDTYTITDLVVCDLLNSDRESLYNRYCAYNGIPAGEQLPYLRDALKEDSLLEKQLHPVYLMARVTTAQGEAMGDLSAKDTSVKLSISEAVDNSTDAKTSFAAVSRSIAKTVLQAIQENEDEAKALAEQQAQQAQEALQQQESNQQED